MSESRRFDDEQYLLTWKATGRFPAIHDDIFSLIATHASGPAVYLDLCCSTGLLAEQVRQRVPGAQVVGVDGDLRALKRGYDAGLKFPRVNLWIMGGNFQELRHFIVTHKVDTLLARRCLPELFGQTIADMHWAPHFVNTLKSAGVRRIFVQGRVPVRHAKNVLRSVQEEVEILHTGYELKSLVGQCAYLEAREHAEL